jgi:glycosyltransferase involved in cell wall biosynthesis
VTALTRIQGATTRPDPVVAVVQDGARLHYALPLALQREGLLGVMFTDWFVRAGSGEDAIAALLRRIAPDLGQRLSGRRCIGLLPERVMSNPLIALKAWLARFRDERAEVREARLSQWIGAWIARQGWRGANCLMGFVRSIDPALCEAARAAGLATIVDQIIAPAGVEHAAMRRQAARWPEWAPAGGPPRPDQVIALEARTWQAADRITCPSPYVQDGLILSGVSPERISVLPYPIDAAAWEPVDRTDRTGPVTVGFVGSVGLRKGAPAVFELARWFDPARVRFVMVGPPAAPPHMLTAAGGRVELTGPVPRSAIRARFRAFDVFLLPSACEGSAGSIMEAMASKLPIVTTPTAGAPIEDGREGFLRDSQDLDGLASCIDRLAGDPALRARMGLAGRQRAELLGLDGYGRSLRAVLEGALGCRPEAAP